MAGRFRPGPDPLTTQRTEFGRLIASGISNAEACRRVGVHRRTGTRWRFGRTVVVGPGLTREYAPVIVTTCRPVSARFLSEAERVVIADLRRDGATLRMIAAELGRSASTVSRELRRNVDKAGRYRPLGAHRLAAARRRRPGRHRLASDEVLHGQVQCWLDAHWSPEQISRSLNVAFPDEQRRQLSLETVYQGIYAGVVRRDRQALRSGRTRRRAHRTPEQRRPVGKRRPLTERPTAAAGRSEPGHWEGDLIMGSHNRSAIGTLVDRCTRQVVLVHLPSKSADAVAAALVATFATMPAELRRSLTWDQGTELSSHEQITEQSGVPVYFCDKASPWQRPSNENSNGLLRQYFPKGSDLSVHTPGDLERVSNELNQRPRRVLGWRTPADLVRHHLEPSSGIPSDASVLQR